MFKGDDGIAQYVNFLQNKDILDKFELAETSSSVLEIIAEDDECVLTVAYVASVATNAANSNDKLSVTMDVVVGLRTKFSTIDAATIRVHRNDLVSDAIAYNYVASRLIVLSPITSSHTCSRNAVLSTRLLFVFLGRRAKVAQNC